MARLRSAAQKAAQRKAALASARKRRGKGKSKKPYARQSFNRRGGKFVSKRDQRINKGIAGAKFALSATIVAANAYSSVQSNRRIKAARGGNVRARSQ